MEFKNKASYAIKDWQNFKDDEDISLAIANVSFLSTRPNSHKHVYSEEVLKEYAPSYLGKFVVAEYDEYLADTTTHTDNQIPVGYVPSNQEVKYTIAEDGYMDASVDVVISKIYAKNVYELFKLNKKKSVSVEQLVGFTPETASFEDGIKDKVIVGFEGIGITILGEGVLPSVPNANITMVRMSSDNVGEIETKYAEIKEEDMADHLISTSKKDLDESDWDGNKAKDDLLKEKNFETLAPKVCMLLGENWKDRVKGDLKYPIMNLKDGKWVYNAEGISSALAYAKQHEPSIVGKIEKIWKKMGLDSEEKMAQILEKLSNIENKLNEEDKMAKELKETEELEAINSEEETVMEEPTNDKSEEQEEEMACGDGESKEEAKMSNEEIDVMVSKMEKMEIELERLQKFEEETLNSKRDSVIAETMSSIKDLLDEETFNKYQESGKACKYEDINGWKNEVMAKVSTIALSKLSELKDKKDEEVMDMGIVGNEQSNKAKTYYDVF